MVREKRGFLLHLFHNLTPEDLIVDSHCTWSAGNLCLVETALLYFRRQNICPGLSGTVLGAKLLEESHVCLTDTLEGACTEF